MPAVPGPTTPSRRSSGAPRGVRRRGVRVGLAALTAGVLAAPLLVAATSTAAPVNTLAAAKKSDAAHRAQTAPNVMWPLAGARGTYQRNSTSAHPSVVINASCGTTVRAATPGRAYVSKSSWGGPHLVRVITSTGKLTTYYGYMSSTTVRVNGQLIQSGQKLGVVGHTGSASHCSLYFAAVGSAGKTHYVSSRWLNNHVGGPVPVTSLLDDHGFTLATFNTLGASHTPSSRYPGYASRVPRQVSLLNQLGIDVAGLQEFQAKQKALFLTDAKGTFGIYPSAKHADTENSIIWRNSTMELMAAGTFAVPYFDGHVRQMPVVRLRERATGRQAYFINVHNPATIKKYGNQTKWRAKAIAIERARVIALRRSGLPVFLTGDLNDKAPAFCGLTANVLMIAPNSEPSSACAPLPPKSRIDWIFAAGPARFLSYTMSFTPKNEHITDHPIVYTKAFLGPAGS